MIEENLWEGEGAPTWLETPVTDVPALKLPVDIQDRPQRLWPCRHY
jgi:hypothetical protein